MPRAGTFVHDGRIHMVGGHTTPDGGTKSVDPDILVLEPGGQWDLLGELPMPLSSPAAAILGGRLYVAGGSKDGRSVQGRVWVGRLALMPGPVLGIRPESLQFIAGKRPSLHQGARISDTMTRDSRFGPF